MPDIFVSNNQMRSRGFRIHVQEDSAERRRARTYLNLDRTASSEEGLLDREETNAEERERESKEGHHRHAGGLEQQDGWLASPSNLHHLPTNHYPFPGPGSVSAVDAR